jgi:hypothetical protein
VTTARGKANGKAATGNGKGNGTVKTVKRTTATAKRAPAKRAAAKKS